MKSWLQASGFLLGLMFIWPNFSYAQFFQVKITESGIYKFSNQQLQAAGFSEKSQVSIFGYPGMLPQILDSSQLSLQEIPALETSDGLFVYLQGPHDASFGEKGELNYSHHLYADTLTYLIGKKANPKRIAPIELEENNLPITQTLYQFFTQKEEKTNLLESGKDWYSLPIRSGQSLNLNFNLSSSSTQAWILSGTLMAQASSASTMRVLTGDEILEELAFSPIPAATYGVKGFEQSFQKEFLPTSKTLNQLRFTYQGGSGIGFLDQITVAIPREEKDWTKGVFQSKSKSKIQIANTFLALEISDFHQPVLYSGNFSIGKKWAIASPANLLSPIIGSPINLELREGGKAAQLLILTSQTLLSSAKKLQSHKQAMGISTEMALLEDIYSSFSYGNPDLVAIRNFVAWRFHSEKTLKNVLILGKGTYDYKGISGGRPNLVPIFTSENSLDPLKTYSSDDFYALIDWGQGEWEEENNESEDLQIGIGRIPAINFTEANEVIEKIIHYETEPIQGDWKRKIALLADDGDQNIHLRDAEKHADFLASNHPEFLIQKLYLDRFAQETTGQRQTSPKAKSALESAQKEGVLLLNYIGHGNETTLTAEEIFQVSDLSNWSETAHLPLWMTATCEFGRHDSPFIRSAAEELIFAKKKGAIALLSTGRPVFSSVNFELNRAFIEEISMLENGQYQDMGTVFKNTKNKSHRGVFNRNFSLLGDPSLRLQTADLSIGNIEFKSIDTDLPTDTLRPLQKIQLSAKILDPISEAIQVGFDGEFEIEIWDNPTESISLGDESSPMKFQEEANLLFKGTGEVKAGEIISKIMLPKNLDPEVELGKIRIWAKEKDLATEAKGYAPWKIGGEPISEIQDLEGPQIQISLKNQTTETQVISSNSTEVLFELQDPSGINSSKSNPNQLLQIQINEDPAIFVGNLFEALDGNFEIGRVLAKVNGLKEGKNQLRIWAWDNAGNGSEKSIEIEVRGSEKVRILSHIVYPNPAKEIANFKLQHNRPGETLILTLEIHSLEAQILFSESFRLVKADEKIENITWNFFQNLTKYPAKGTYIYKLALLSEVDFTSDFISGKLVIE